MEPEAVKELVKQDETGMLPNARDYQSPNPFHIPDPWWQTSSEHPPYLRPRRSLNLGKEGFGAVLSHLSRISELIMMSMKVEDASESS